MIGPPGSGKTMMARCLPGILPDMTLEEALEVTRIHSAAGTLAADAGLMAERPFRAPHHTVSAVALVGGGTKARPGEISLAHDGVLFLDELPEYDRGALEALRQPLEDGFVSVVRVSAQAKYPARAMLVAAMNPCPCGNYGSATQPCRCTQKEIARYLGRISGPLLDRIDMQLEVTAVPVRQITESAPEEPSADIHKRVQAARERQQKRYAGEGISCNGGTFRAPAGNVLPAGRRLPRADRQGLRQIQPLHARGQPRAQGRADNRRPRGGGKHRQGAYSGSAAVSQSGRELLEVKRRTKGNAV